MEPNRGYEHFFQNQPPNNYINYDFPQQPFPAAPPYPVQPYQAPDPYYQGGFQISPGLQYPMGNPPQARPITSPQYKQNPQAVMPIPIKYNTPKDRAKRIDITPQRERVKPKPQPDYSPPREKKTPQKPAGKNIQHSPAPKAPQAEGQLPYDPREFYGMGNSKYYANFYAKMYQQNNLPDGNNTQQTVYFDDKQLTASLYYRHMQNVQPGKSPEAKGEQILEVSSQFQRILKELQRTNRRFEDSTFPANLQSLVGDVMHTASFNPSNIVWARPEEFLKPGFQVFSKSIEPSDIQQGQLGDCYFLSSLASLAESPKRIERLFITKQVNPYGIYCVLLCSRGEWKEVFIDDRFPCIRDFGQGGKLRPVFSKSSGDGELWVLILEKAWAKVHGSYAKIEAGISREALHELTAAPTRPIFINNPNLVGEIVNANKRSWVLTASSDIKASRIMGNYKTGLLSSHCYSILGIYEVDAAVGRVCLIKLRNPWGKLEWNGDWNDKSPLWTPALRAQLGVREMNEGTFFISFTDFQKHFHDLQICMVDDTFKYCAIRVRTRSQTGVFYSIRVDRESEYYFTFNQESKRKFPHSANYKYSPVRLLLARRESNGRFTPISGAYKSEMEVWTGSRLAPGEYILFVKAEWRNGDVNEGSLSSYGIDEVRLHPLEATNEFLEAFMQNFFKEWALLPQNAGKKTVLTTNGITRWQEITDMGFAYWYYYNPSPQTTLIEEISLLNPEGIQFRGRETPYRTRVTVPPKKDALVLAKVSNEGFRCTISYRMQISG